LLFALAFASLLLKHPFGFAISKEAEL